LNFRSSPYQEQVVLLSPEYSLLYTNESIFIGYKLHQQIGKALQRRSDAIRKAINRYNTQAAALNPPHPKISWKDIVGYGFLGEFDLLRHSRNDIRSSDWSKPIHRDATTKFYRLCRAHEEITRLNVEVRRLCTAIHDEDIQVSAVIQNLLISDPPLACELQRQWRLRAAVNAVHCYRLDCIENLPGFSGVGGVGVRLEHTAGSACNTSVAHHGMFCLIASILFILKALR